jgi:hypothetical protein
VCQQNWRGMRHLTSVFYLHEMSHRSLMPPLLPKHKQI